MKRNEIIGKLIKEGFTSETLANMNDKQLNMLSKRILKEQITNTTSSSSTNVPVKNIPKTNSAAVDQAKRGKETFVTYEGEVKEGDKKWIQKAIKKPGALHKSLGVPKDEKIPAAKLNTAAKKGGKIGKRARLAKTLKSLHEVDTQKIETKKEIKEWVETLVKKRYLCIATKNEIMESIQTKMMEQETAPAPVKEPKTKPGVKPDQPDTEPSKPSRNPVVLPGKPGWKPGALPDADPKFQNTEPEEPEDQTDVTSQSDNDSNDGNTSMPEFLSFNALLSAGTGNNPFDRDSMNESVKNIMNKIKKSLN